VKLNSLSASSGAVYEECPARWQSEYGVKMPTIGGSAANLGSACHEVFQKWVEEGHYLTITDAEAKTEKILLLWSEAYVARFSDFARYDEGRELCLKWLARQSWTGRTVLHTEQKHTWMMPTSAGPIPFNYIMDRVDRLDSGAIEVIDYKSVSSPIPPEELKVRLQSRVYAAMAWMEHPDAPEVWVVFDLLRHDEIGVRFSAEECKETVAYVLGLAERILADDDPKELLGSYCRWCSRKEMCETLKAHIAEAGSGAVSTDINELVVRRVELDGAMKAIKGMLESIDLALLEALDEAQESELAVGGFVVGTGQSRRRVVDVARLVEQIGLEKLVGIADVKLTKLDALIKELPSEDASLVNRAISWRNGAKTLYVRKAKT
jgi:RecB family exonuclease